MRKDDFTNFVTMFIIFIGFITIMIFMLTYDAPEPVLCEKHEYVVTSEYNIMAGQYKTVSKCAKCGHTVR